MLNVLNLTLTNPRPTIPNPHPPQTNLPPPPLEAEEGEGDPPTVEAGEEGVIVTMNGDVRDEVIANGRHPPSICFTLNHQ